MLLVRAIQELEMGIKPRPDPATIAPRQPARFERLRLLLMLLLLRRRRLLRLLHLASGGPLPNHGKRLRRQGDPRTRLAFVIPSDTSWTWPL